MKIRIMLISALLAISCIFMFTPNKTYAAWSTPTWSVPFIYITDYHWGYCGWCGWPYDSWHKNIFVKWFSWQSNDSAIINIHHTKYNWNQCSKMWESKTNICWNICGSGSTQYAYLTSFIYWALALCGVYIAWALITSAGWVAIFAI